jgi:ubiquinone/menaquinone biosynthesis C-methylase UbiE
MPEKTKINDRMNMLHYVLYHIFGKKHFLTEFTTGELPKRVLDIGCGTGIWIHDVAKEWAAMGHTDVEFIGIDLVPIQSPMVPCQSSAKITFSAMSMSSFIASIF